MAKSEELSENEKLLFSHLNKGDYNVLKARLYFYYDFYWNSILIFKEMTRRYWNFWIYQMSESIVWMR